MIQLYLENRIADEIVMAITTSATKKLTDVHTVAVKADGNRSTSEEATMIAAR